MCRRTTAALTRSGTRVNGRRRCAWAELTAPAVATHYFEHIAPLGGEFSINALNQRPAWSRAPSEYIEPEDLGRELGVLRDISRLPALRANKRLSGYVNKHEKVKIAWRAAGRPPVDPDRHCARGRRAGHAIYDNNCR